MCLAGLAVLLVVAITPFGGVAAARMLAGQFRLEIVDDESGEPIAARMVLTRSDGSRAPVRRGVDAGVGTVVDGETVIALPPDSYQFEISRGPEYRTIRGSFTLDRNSDDADQVRLPRILNMAAEGWIGGDPLVSVPPRDLPPRMRGADLNVAGLAIDAGEEASAVDVGAESADVHVMTKIVRGRGPASGLAVFGLSSLPQTDASALDGDAPMRVSSDFIRAVSGASGTGEGDPRLVIVNPMDWDVPIWLASERVRGVVVQGEFLQPGRRVLSWPGSRPGQGMEFSGPQGLGRWSEEIFLRTVDAGFVLAPMAASGAGRVRNPVGFSRTYAYLGPQEIDTDGGDTLSESAARAWWDQLWSGATVMTGGPLLRPMLEDHPPGHEFNARGGERLELTLELRLATTDPVDYLEVIRNGRVAYSARLDEYAQQGGRIPPLVFEESGWAVVRVVTRHEDHYRAATSAPWYVVFDGQRRISAEAVAFFQQWLDERESQLAALPPAELAPHVPYVQAARRFWQKRAEAATAR